MKKYRGFTLVELIIAIAIIGLLSAIALPSYREYVNKSNRTLAKTAMSEIASQQQSYYTERKGYQTTLGSLLKVSGTPATVYLNRKNEFSAAQSADSLYAMQLVAHAADVSSCAATGSASSVAWTIKATPVGSQVNDTRCANLCLSSTGGKGASGSSASSCW